MDSYNNNFYNEFLEFIFFNYENISPGTIFQTDLNKKMQKKIV